MDIIDFLHKKHNITLNSQQQQGVLCGDRNTLLLAVPGSGKTTVLVSRIANLIMNCGVSSNDMLTLTYSRETAKDMKRRYTELFEVESVDIPQFKTIHSFCYSVMQYYARIKHRTMPNLISDPQLGGLKTKVMREIYQKINEEYLSDDLLETLDRQISYSKNMMLSITQMEELSKEIRNFDKIYSEYESFKKSNMLIDYDDMLLYTYDIFKKLPEILNRFNSRYRFINIDEAQDTSILQHKIIQLISKDNTVFMVGDEDQSIYSFRGAFPQALLEFDKLYGNSQIIKMEQNFRSNSEIVLKANSFIKQNKQRYDKEMFCENEIIDSINTVSLKDYSEQYQHTIEYIKALPNDKTIAILYRNNESAIPVIDLLYKNSINFYIKEHRITYFSSFVVRDLLAFMMLSFDQTDIESFRQIYYKLGLPKGAFEFVQRNIDNYDSVFLCVLELSSLISYKREQMQFYKTAFKRMNAMKPYKAIEYILDTLGYQSYIENRLSDGFTKTNAYQKINTAKCIAHKIDTVGEFIDKLYYLENAISSNKNIDKASNINLTTFHSSKGLEYDVVIILDAIKDIIPSSDAVQKQLFGELDEIENETRLFYVGITRAKQKLILFKSNLLNGTITMPSRFIDKLSGSAFIGKHDEGNAVENILGKSIIHKVFGSGTVKNQNGDVITINFEKSGTKNLSYSYCMGLNYLEMIEK